MEQGNDIPSVIEEVFKRYTDGSYIKASMLPDLDLYVDQIPTFLTRHLAKTIRFEDDKIMTKTMINNFTKNHLLPPPDKKKYSRDHILLMIFIYYFKNFLPISDSRWPECFARRRHTLRLQRRQVLLLQRSAVSIVH